jgi:hypothetical protein
MGFFDRINNLGKGMIKVWADPDTRGRESERKLKALEEELERVVGRSPKAAAPASQTAGKRATADEIEAAYLTKLERAFKNGVLTEDEYNEKRAAWLEAAPKEQRQSDVPVDEQEPVKRTL